MKKILSEELASVMLSLNKLLQAVPIVLREKKCIEGTGGLVSPSDLLAYQIGWGSLLLTWYKAGIAGDVPQMPGDGFTRWDYTGLAKHFYQKYAQYDYEQKIAMLNRLVSEIMVIVQEEEKRGRIDQLGVWGWCMLPSGKPWPLSKWIRVNTIAPYKRMVILLRRIIKEQPAFVCDK